jgi:hypothetical protein
MELAKKRIRWAWGFIVLSRFFHLGTSDAECVNGFVRSCEGYDFVKIVCGIVAIVLTFRFWRNLNELYEGAVKWKLGVAVTDLAGVAVLLEGFEGNCSCPPVFQGF